MPKVKDFALKVLAEIETALAETLPSRDIKTRDIKTLGYYQTEEWFAKLLKTELKYRSGELDAHLKEEEKTRLLAEAELEATEESLQLFIGALKKQIKFIWESNCIYTSMPTSAATRVAVVLAKNLDEFIKNSTHKHYYDYMFEGLPCSRFISSKGRFQDMSLNEFFFTPEGYPVEVLACLDQYRSKRQSVYPKHVCIPEADWPNKKCPELTEDDKIRLCSHSQEANQYCWAIDHKKSDEELDECRQKLVEAIARKEFIPGYQYVDSDKTLQTNGVLNDFHLTSVDVAAKWLVRIQTDDWPGVVKCLEYDTILSMLLPKTPAVGDKPGKPDTSIFKRGNEAKVAEFLNNPKWYVPCGEDMRLNIAAFYLLAELLKRVRGRELDHTGVVAQATGLATTKDQKICALEFFQEFLLSGRCPNQLSDYAKAKGKQDDYLAWLQEGRTALLTDKAKTLWESLIQQATLSEQPAEEDCKSGKFIYNEKTLLGDARTLCKYNKSRWEETVLELYDPAKGRLDKMQSYVLSFLSPRNFLDRLVTRNDDFANCVAHKGHYSENDHTLSKAVLYLFVHYYAFYRNLENDNKSKGGKIMRAPDKKAKLDLVDAFKSFLCSDYELNEFSKFITTECKEEQRAGLLATLGDSPLFSDLSVLIAQAANIYSPGFFAEDPVAEAPPSAVWSYAPSWFGGSK